MDGATVWDANWAWSLPLIVVTVIFHVIGLVLLNEQVLRARRFLHKGRAFLATFSFVLGTATLVAILLHALEAGMWAGLYVLLGALPDGRSALLFSLSAITTYAHEHFDLAAHWRLMGSLEALDGYPVWPDHRLFVRDDPGTAARSPWSTPLGILQFGVWALMMVS